MTSPGSLPLPASAELLQGMHLLAFFVFVILASVSFGWPVMTLVAEALGAGRGDTSLRRVAVWLARRTPGALTLAVVFAIPVALLTMVRYGEAVLPAAQHMGWFWLAVAPLLLVGSGFSFWVALRRRGTEPSTIRPFLPDIVESYILAFRRRGVERPGWVLTVVSSLSLAGIGFVICAHSVLLVNPELWGPCAGEPTGTLLPLGDPQLLPRMLHMLLGALAISGFTVAWHGAGRFSAGDYAYGRTALGFGGLWLAIPVGLEAFAGMWFLHSLPADVTAEFTGRSVLYTVAFWSGVVAAGAAVLLAVGAMMAATPRAPLVAGAAALVASVLSRVAVHQRVRELMVDVPLSLPTASVTHPEMVALFAVVAALGLAGLIYMVSATSSPRPAP